MGTTGFSSTLLGTTASSVGIVTTTRVFPQGSSADTAPAVCRGPLGEEKVPGDTWTANCHQCTCMAARSVDCRPRECPAPPTCGAGEKVVTFSSSDTYLL
ncbi:apomucin-like [Erinaceus europaeus]|uniref:Apomucin-like n=1 Tax=Erinaceus europaeus TaxID=9365 RepID=A0ABM3WT82_ERIEU|nr:apomucin-like [Erinaceus europaeus]XP_060039772.1 apomucin-like [Erinaceus europaeus]XP_060039774.1 apomucin-like [Erinaceus europaeus]XP_060039778.1 apomucin-like [Erinaceus europaeus]XP_060039782.1 apomucin-like [Erinaceus europaeus]